MASSAAALLAAGLAAVAAGRLLVSSRRGIDFTDEGMYILAATADSPATAFNNAFGRYTGLLYDVTGGDLVRFRQLGILVLVGVGAMLGDRVAVCGARLVDIPISWQLRVAAGAAVAAGAIHYYLLHLLTPSYNWLNLVGMGIGLSGILGMVTLSADGSRLERWWSPAVFAIGIQVAAMGKITSGPALVIIAVVVLGVARTEPGIGRFVVMRTAAGAGVASALLHAVFINPWSVTADQVRRGASMLRKLDPDYSTHQQIDTIKDGIEIIVREAPGRFGLVLAPVLVIAILARFRPVPPILVAGARAVAVAGTGAVLFAQGLWLGGTAGYSVLTWVGIAFVLTTAFLAAVRADSHRREGVGKGMLVALMLMACAGAYSIGSNNGFFRQLNGGTLFLIAGAAMILTVSRPFKTDPALLVLSVVVGLGANSLVSDSFNQPYRQPPLAQQTVAVELGGGTVHLDTETASFIDRLRGSALANGWVAGTPLLDMSPYAATTLVILEAEPPITILPSVGGHQGQQALGVSNFDDLVASELVERFHDAWVQTMTGGGGGEENLDTALLERVGRSFPIDYELVGEFELVSRGQTLALWRPIDTAIG